jgi:hypothetical protein
VLNEVSRVLRDGGLAIVYEDMPAIWWDRVVCWTHDRQWRGRTGPCTFQAEQGWRRMFNLAGFEIVKERPLSRWRNLAHPVSRRFFVIRTTTHTQDAQVDLSLSLECGDPAPLWSHAKRATE